MVVIPLVRAHVRRSASRRTFFLCPEEKSSAAGQNKKAGSLGMYHRRLPFREFEMPSGESLFVNQRDVQPFFCISVPAVPANG